MAGSPSAANIDASTKVVIPPVVAPLYRPVA